MMIRTSFPKALVTTTVSITYDQPIDAPASFEPH